MTRSHTATSPTVGAQDLPALGTWRIDPGHTEVAFVGRHFLLTKVRGRFVGVQGAVRIGPSPALGHVEVEIDMASVDSGDATRDEHLRSPDLFDVERWPTAHFRSTAVVWSGTSGEVTGDLTIRDVTRPVTLSVDYLGQVEDPWGNERAAFAAETSIDRDDWGVSWNMPLANGGLVVSKRIDIELNVETVLESDGPSPLD